MRQYVELVMPRVSSREGSAPTVRMPEARIYELWWFTSQASLHLKHYPREQANGTYALEQQCRQLKTAGCNKIYLEVGHRSDANRPEFQSLLEDCDQGEIDEVVVVRVDRLSGHVPTLCNTKDPVSAMMRFCRAL